MNARVYTENKKNIRKRYAQLFCAQYERVLTPAERRELEYCRKRLS